MSTAADWKDAALANKVSECLTLRRLLGQTEQAALRFLGQPFSRACRADLQAQIETNRRAIAAHDLGAQPPLQAPPALTSGEPTVVAGAPLPGSPNLASPCPQPTPNPSDTPPTA